MGEHEASLQEHLSQVPQAQFVAEAPQDDEQHDVRRVFQEIEGCAGAFVEGAPTRGLPE
jgi:hypothetical protein